MPEQLDLVLLSKVASLSGYPHSRTISIYISFHNFHCHTIMNPSTGDGPSSKKSEKLKVVVLHQDEQEFRRVFEYIDENGDGKISPSELRSCLRVVGVELSDEEAEAVVSSSDSDGDGLLAFEDFVRLVGADEAAEESMKSLREAFAMYEAEGGGGITAKSLKRMLGRLGETRTTEQCVVMIQAFDLDGDGVISFEEFKVMMLRSMSTAD